MTTVVFTDDQQAGADAYFDFLFSDAKTFVISGGAGVGKTFLMSKLCSDTMKEYQDACKLLGQTSVYDQLTFTATTNKAAEVLEQTLKLPVQTIHSFLGLKVQNDYKTGKTRLIKTNSWKKRYKHIVFIDESSMIDSMLYQTILESFENSKIVFVGDHAQMAPVDEQLSPVYQNVDPDNFVFLAEPVRNAGTPALVDLCAQLRGTVETGRFQPIMPVPGVIDYLTDAQMEAELHACFQDPEPSARVLCYTNDRVQTFNDYIRSDVRGLPTQIQEDDILVVAQTAQALNGDNINVERELKVLKLGPIQIDDNHTDLFPDNQPITYREAVVQLLSGGAVTYTVRIPEEMPRVAYAKQHYKKTKSWQQFFGLQETYADLRDKACCTVYKSQGSTYDTVFIDIGNIGTSFNAEQVARMLFVAVSRATTRVCLYGRLPGRYQGEKAA